VDIRILETIIYEIQQDIFNSSDIEYFNITMSTNAFNTLVDFCGIEIWNSEDDCREYVNEVEDIRESMNDYLRKQINREIAKLNTVKV